MPRGYTNKVKAMRPPVGEISVGAERLAACFCTHVKEDELPCINCMNEAQHTINNSKKRNNK